MSAFNKMREEMSRKFIDALKEEKIPWEQEWTCAGRPVNPVSNTTYRGVNCLWLWLTMIERGYDDPRFMTFKQASEKGWSIKKGDQKNSTALQSSWRKKERTGADESSPYHRYIPSLTQNR